jgi:hypothetical protein
LDLERKDLAHNKIVQYIRNASQEIRDLEHKLSAARMNKELSVQIKERKLREKQLKVQTLNLKDAYIHDICCHFVGKRQRTCHTKE